MSNIEKLKARAQRLSDVIRDREASIESYYDMLYRNEIDEKEHKFLCNMQEKEIKKNERALYKTLAAIKAAS